MGWRSWEKGTSVEWGVRVRKYGEVFKARNKKAGAYVAIRKMRGLENAERVQCNYEILKDLDCPCIEKCYGMMFWGSCICLVWPGIHENEATGSFLLRHIYVI